MSTPTCRRALHNGHAPLRGIPVGYGLTVIAVVVFAAAAFGDLAWHMIFGIEQSITILFSPTHLVLVAASTGPVGPSCRRCLLAAIVLVPASRSENQAHTPAP